MEKQKVDCTGNAVKGDYVFFQRAMFSGKYPNAVFDGYEDIEGLITNDSYGAQKNQHTFTIKTSTGDTIRIKGRNLYRNGTQRLLWDDESKRVEALENKYKRKKSNVLNIEPNAFDHFWKD